MDGTNVINHEAELPKPLPVIDEVKLRLLGLLTTKSGAIQANAAEDDAEKRREARRETRRRDIEIVRVAVVESVLNTNEYLAGRLPDRKREPFEQLRDPLAALANLSRAVIQLTIAEERLDETAEERAARKKAEAAAKARAAQAAWAQRAGAAEAAERAQTKREVHATVRAITLNWLEPHLDYEEREAVFDDVFLDFERANDYSGDPADLIADIVTRMGAEPKVEPGEPPLGPLARRERIVEIARAYIESMRGEYEPDDEDDCADAGILAPVAPPAQAQGPPN